MTTVRPEDDVGADGAHEAAAALAFAFACPAALVEGQLGYMRILPLNNLHSYNIVDYNPVEFIQPQRDEEKNSRSGMP